MQQGSFNTTSSHVELRLAYTLNILAYRLVLIFTKHLIALLPVDLKLLSMGHTRILSPDAAPERRDHLLKFRVFRSVRIAIWV